MRAQQGSLVKTSMSTQDSLLPSFSTVRSERLARVNGHPKQTSLRQGGFVTGAGERAAGGGKKISSPVQ